MASLKLELAYIFLSLIICRSKIIQGADFKNNKTTKLESHQEYFSISC